MELFKREFSKLRVVSFLNIWALAMAFITFLPGVIIGERIASPWYYSMIIAFAVSSAIVLSFYFWKHMVTTGRRRGLSFLWGGAISLIVLQFFHYHIEEIEFWLTQNLYLVIAVLAALVSTPFISTAFREKEALEQFFLRRVAPSVTVGEGDHVVAFYTSKANKMRVFSAYIHEGLVNGDKIVYVFPDSDAGLVERILKKNGVDVKRCVKSGSLTMLSTSEWYRGGVYDTEMVSKNVLGEIENAKEAGYKHLRTIVDYGDVHQVFKDTKQFLDELRKATKRVVQPYLITLRTFNVETLSEEEIQWLKEYGVRNLFISGSFSIEMLDAFSRRLGLKHGELVGKRILFEFDTASNYEAAVEDFVFEGRANGESVVIFTRRGSGLHSDLAKRRALRFFHLTAQVSVPTIGASENQILLPANDTSLLLDALNKTMKTHPHGDISIVFESLSDLVLSIGFEKAYNFMRYALDMLSSSRVTALFLLNPSAHDPKVASSLRNLFSNQVTYGKEGLQVIKLHRPS